MKSNEEWSSQLWTQFMRFILSRRAIFKLFICFAMSWNFDFVPILWRHFPPKNVKIEKTKTEFFLFFF